MQGSHPQPDSWSGTGRVDRPWLCHGPRAGQGPEHGHRGAVLPPTSPGTGRMQTPSSQGEKGKSSRPQRVPSTPMHPSPNDIFSSLQTGKKKKLNLPHGISQEFQCRSIKMFCFKLHRNMTIPCRIFNYLHSTVSPEIQDTAKVY